MLMRGVKRDPQMTTRAMEANLAGTGLSASRSTITRVLNRNDLKACHPQKTSLLKRISGDGPYYCILFLRSLV